MAALTIRCRLLRAPVRHTRAALAGVCLWVVGCEGAAVSHAATRASEAPAQGVAEEGARNFGSPLDAQVPFVSLGSLLAAPDPHLGRELRTSGVVRRVCQKAGCWLELGPEGSAKEALRVPMAGHAFFIPTDAVDQRAEVQGTLSARPLPQSTRDHLAGEGAHTLGPLSLDATAVRVAP